jgi:hypothetical protein
MQTDSGMLDLMESDGNVMFVAVGHNHGNDYCCPVGESSLHFCFGRHSGYGGYTSVSTRGARVYELKLLEEDKIRRRLVEDGQNQVQWNTWVRLEEGNVIDEYGSAATSAYQSSTPSSEPTLALGSLSPP